MKLFDLERGLGRLALWQSMTCSVAREHGDVQGEGE